MIPIKSAHRWLTIAHALTEASFILPVIMLFYGYKGVGMGDFFLIQGICCLCIFAFEVPTGYIGDIFSRKNTVLIGMLTWLIGHLVLIFSAGFWMVLLGEIIFALSISLISGTLEAYLYDILKRRHKEGIFHKKYAKMKTLNNLFLTLATLTGSTIYEFYGPLAPLWLTVFFTFIAIIITCLLPDVPESKRIVEKDKSKIQDIMDISKYALKNKELKWLMLFPAVYGTLTLVLMWGLQSVMVATKLPIFMFSFMVGLNAIMRTFWSSISGKILEKINLSGIIKLESIIIVVASVAASIAVYTPQYGTYICLLMMILGSSSVVLANVSTSVLINHRIQSNERATVLSVNSMVNRVFWGLGMICLKPMFDIIGVGPTFMTSSILLVPILLCAHRLYKMNLNMMK